jgi:hypothetical protein
MENEELVDYEEEDVVAPEIVKNEVGLANGGAEEKDKKGSYVGIHSTGFRFVFSSACRFFGSIWVS